MIRALAIELRRSPFRWVLPILLLFVLGILFLRDTRWIGVWPEASAAVQNSAWFIAPVMAGGAAWAAGRTVRTGVAEQFGAVSRPAWQREVVQLSASLLYGIVPFAAGAAVAAAATFSNGGAGFLWPSYLLLGLSLIVMATALGHMIGRLHHSFLTPLIAAAIVIAALVVQTPELSVLSGPPHLNVDRAALLARLLLAAALAAAAVAVAVLVDHSRHRVLGVVTTAAGAAVAVLIAVTATLATPSVQQPRQPVAEPLCSHTSPQVCIWPEHRKYLSDLAGGAEQLSVLESDIGVVNPDMFVEHGLDGSDHFEQATFALHLGGEWAAVRGMVSSVFNATFADGMCPAQNSEANELRTAAMIDLREWLVGRAFDGPKPPGLYGGWPDAEKRAAQVLEQPEQAQFTWAETKLETIADPPCE